MEAYQIIEQALVKHEAISIRFEPDPNKDRGTPFRMVITIGNSPNEALLTRFYYHGSVEEQWTEAPEQVKRMMESIDRVEAEYKAKHPEQNA